uniref:Uncharacterized protein n=2 Tax=Meloidogyne TaxID=189290 RepID=A0A6V7VSI7_MELEN|nr:unnamed protein product [Meloidogyne enterolobii]
MIPDPKQGLNVKQYQNKTAGMNQQSCNNSENCYNTVQHSGCSQSSESHYYTLIYKTSDVTITQQFFQQQQYIQSGTNTKQQIITSSQSEIANVSMGVSSTVVSMSQNNVKVSSAGEALNLGSGMSTYPFTIIIL